MSKSHSAAKTATGTTGICLTTHVVIVAVVACVATAALGITHVAVTASGMPLPSNGVGGMLSASVLGLVAMLLATATITAISEATQ